MTDRLTPEREAEIAARAAAATKGPWSANNPIGVVTNEGGDPLAVFGGCAQDRADAEFTAHAREDVAALLAELQHERYWLKVGWDKAHAYNERWVRDDERLAEERRLVGRLRKELSRQGRAHKDELAAARAERDQAQDRVAELEAERHSTNEALDDAVQALREAQARLAEYERPSAEGAAS